MHDSQVIVYIVQQVLKMALFTPSETFMRVSEGRKSNEGEKAFLNVLYIIFFLQLQQFLIYFIVFVT
jgi:hypothetical protein